METTIQISDKLYCPWCGMLVFDFNDTPLEFCPHVKMVYVCGGLEADFIVHVDHEFAERYIAMMRKSDCFTDILENYEGDPSDIDKWHNQFISEGMPHTTPISEFGIVFNEAILSDSCTDNTIIFKDIPTRYGSYALFVVSSGHQMIYGRDY